MRKNINNYIENYFQNTEEYMDYKLKKYEYKLEQYNSRLKNIYFHFNTYSKPITEKYQKLLSIVKTNFSYINEASREQHVLIGRQANTLCKEDYSARLKFTIGSFNINFTLFIMNQYNIVDSAMNIIITNNNECYIETIAGFDNNILIDTLKEICNVMGLTNINTFSIYQPETDYLINNGFVLNKRYLRYEL
jgi:hypothetical protein